MKRKYLLIGGTGTLGKCMTEYLSDHACAQEDIIIFSRDELKQQQMKAVWPDAQYIIGDIMNYDSIYDAIHYNKATHVFHFAALKHIDVFEDNVKRGNEINFIGLQNACAAAMQSPHVERFIFSSTDKAVLPINAYGFSKATGEKYLQNINNIAIKNGDKPRCQIFRWGNILGSRGSVIHTFAKSIREQGLIRLTDERMTRFWIPIQDAVDFMYQEVIKEQPNMNFIFIPQCKTAPVPMVAQVIAEIIGVTDYEIITTGLRPGEKIHECLYTSHDYCLTSDKGTPWDRAELKTAIERVLSC